MEEVGSEDRSKCCRSEFGAGCWLIYCQRASQLPTTTRRMWFSSSRAALIAQLLLQLCRSSSQFSAIFSSTTLDSRTSSSSHAIKCDGNWYQAKQALCNPNCCVVSISGIDHHLATLQSYFCGDDAPSDIDLRMRVRCCNADGRNKYNRTEIIYEDCANVYNTVMNPSATNNKNENDEQIININPCIQALQELAQGVQSLADGPLQSTVTDVHMRIVCASNYKANDPPFHTDKCPLRGYVTLAGPGTEYMDVTCQPWEYVALRTLGVEGLGGINMDKVGRLRMANELEFIVMKGDYYDASFPDDDVMGSSNNNSNHNESVGNNKQTNKLLWSRSEACVHRSPPGNAGKRVILSLDLADGGDDQEWEERGRKRNWRVGMTQRKSHLVS